MSIVADINISQGSGATHVRCGGIFKYDYVANLLLSLTVKEFWKSVNIWRSYMQEYSVLFLLTRGVDCCEQLIFRGQKYSYIE